MALSEAQRIAFNDHGADMAGRVRFHDLDDPMQLSDFLGLSAIRHLIRLKESDRTEALDLMVVAYRRRKALAERATAQNVRRARPR